MSQLQALLRGGRPGGGNWSSVTPDAVAFLDPIDRICEEPPPRFLRTTHLLAVGLFLALLAVACLTRVDVVVVAGGRLATDAAPIVVQPMERAIIRSLLVRPGDAVRKGQVLATLDPTFAHADMAALLARQRALTAKGRRLQAEAAGVRFRAPDFNADAALQDTLYRQRAAEYLSRLAVFDADIARLQATADATEASRAALGGQVEIARQVEAMRATLLQRRDGSKLQYLQAMDARLQAEREQQAAAAQLPELLHSVRARLAERQSFVDGWRRGISDDLVATRAEASTVGEALLKAARLDELVVVTAAADGVVLDVAQASAGSVLREAEPLLTLIPADAALIAELTIRSRDVGELTPGSPVELKVDAFPYQRHGVLAGRLLSVAEESAPGGGASQGGAAAAGVDSYHRARVALLGASLQHLPPGARLFPGMTLSAEIKVGTRRVIAYFVSPLARGLQESIREP